MKLRTLKIAGCLLIGLATLVFVGGRLVFFWKLKKAIDAQAEVLAQSGTRFSYTSLEVNPWKKSLRMTGVSVHSTELDSMSHSRYTVEQVEVQGIHILPLILFRTLVIESVVVSKPSILLTKQSRPPDRNVSKGNSLSAYKVKELRIDSGHFEVLDDARKQALVVESNLAFTNLHVTHPGTDSLLWHVSTAMAKETRISLPEDFYNIQVQSSSYSGDTQTLRIDSISLEPSLGKMEFAKQTHHQVDQISCQVPFVEFHGIQFTQTLPITISANHVELGFALSVFRDMRFPNAPREPSVLPIPFLRGLPFGIQIDSLTLSPSTISYQELQESGGTPGKIFFDDLRASIKNLSTDSVGESVMQVTSRFMDAGDLTAKFTFPLEKKKPNTVQGVLENFEMTSINQMLEPAANLRVSSGQMQALKFEFQYDDLRSIGKLDLRYSDVKLKSLNSNKERSTNPLGTLLINTIVKNTMDKKDTKAERSGKIDWARDNQSGLLSYWWKSLLSGIKSIFTLDRVLGLN